MYCWFESCFQTNEATDCLYTLRFEHYGYNMLQYLNSDISKWKSVFFHIRICLSFLSCCETASFALIP